MARTDVHSPSKVDPAAYTYEGMVYFGSCGDEKADMLSEMTDRWYEGSLDNLGALDGNFRRKGTCDHCGAAFKYGAVYHHREGELVVVGNRCAAATFDVDSRRELDFKNLRKRVAQERAKVKNRNSVEAQHPGIMSMLDTLRKSHDILADMRRQALARGRLSDRQVEFACKLAREVWAPVHQYDRVEVTEGRRDITGKILTKKSYDGYYGVQVKMLVLTDEGEKVWGTFPEALYGAEAGKGSRIAFRATVSRSNDDPCFGIFKRPSQARKLA